MSKGRASSMKISRNSFLRRDIGNPLGNRRTQENRAYITLKSRKFPAGNTASCGGIGMAVVRNKLEFHLRDCYSAAVFASIAQLVERRSRKAQANGSIPFAGSSLRTPPPSPVGGVFCCATKDSLFISAPWAGKACLMCLERLCTPVASCVGRGLPPRYSLF